MSSTTRNLTTTGSFMTKNVGLLNLPLELFKTSQPGKKNTKVTSRFFFSMSFPQRFAQHLLGPEGCGMLDGANLPHGQM